MSQLLTVSNTGDSQEVDISQSSNTQNVDIHQNENTQSIKIDDQNNVQTIPLSQNRAVQSFTVTQQENAQSFGLTNDVTFMKGDPGDKGDPGFSPTIDVIESANGHTVTVTDISGEKSFFIADGNGTDVDLSDYALKTDIPTIPEWAKAATKPVYTADEVGADISGAADNALVSANKYTDQRIASIPTPDVSGQIGTHNTSTDAHNDIRLFIQDLTDRVNALADSDDDTLDQMSEIVAYIKANRELVEQVTNVKVSVSDIIDNLTTNVSNRPLSAAQGVALKTLIDSIEVPSRVSELENDSGYLTEHQDVSGKIDKSELLNMVYPIGSIYMSVNSVNPQTFIGGTWERLQDRFLLGASSTYSAGNTGGEAMHTLTVDEMPNHNHRMKCGSSADVDKGTWVLIDHQISDTLNSANFRDLSCIEATGGGQAHNNMPPYLAVYMWKRTA